QLPQVVDVHRQLAAEDRDQEAEADHDLAGGDDHHHQGEDLTLLVADLTAEGDERQVAGVQHQLEAEQDHDRAAAEQDSDRADREEQAREDDVPGDVHARAPSGGAGAAGDPSPGCFAGVPGEGSPASPAARLRRAGTPGPPSSSFFRLLARTIAPTAA